MSQSNSFMRWTSRLLIVSMLGLGLPQQAAVAAMIDTDQAISHDLANQDRTKILAFLDRQDVVAQMQKQGVTADEAKQRVAALTDEEAHNVAGKIDQLPAGGDILGILFTIFIVLLVTDILGLTKVFPFTRSIR